MRSCTYAEHKTREEGGREGRQERIHKPATTQTRAHVKSCMTAVPVRQREELQQYANDTCEDVTSKYANM